MRQAPLIDAKLLLRECESEELPIRPCADPDLHLGSCAPCAEEANGW